MLQSISFIPHFYLQTASVSHWILGATNLSTPFLATKFFIPVHTPQVLFRDRLRMRLDEGFQTGKSLTLVCAPAGYGKTTLLSDWVNTQKNSGLRFAWLSLETTENDPVHFFSTVAAALENHLPGITSLIENLFSAPQLPSPENIAAAFLNQFAAFHQTMVFILDDYQVIQNKDIHTATMYVIEHLPPNIHLVLSTRSDPPLALHRLRVRGQLVEIRLNDLKFESEEIRLFLQTTDTVNLQEEEFVILEASTEGWAAGLRMAVLSLQGKSNPATYLHTLSGRHHYIMDYLTEEVLNSLSDEKQNFLIQTSILERLCAPLCNAVTGQQNGQQILEELIQANCFLVELDGERVWFRYHHLFSELLRVRLNQRSQNKPELPAKLHQQASIWFEQNGFSESAIAHSVQAADYENAARIVEKSAIDLFAHGQLHALISWINLLPAEISRQRPWLNVFQAWGFAFAGQSVEANNHIQNAINALDHQQLSPADTVALQAEIAGIQSLLTVTSGNLQAALSLIELPEALIPGSSAFARSVFLWAIGFARRMKGDLTGAKHCFEQVLEIGIQLKNPWTIVTASTDLGTVLRHLGELTQAESVYRKGLSHFRYSASTPGYVGRLEAFLAMLLFERGKRAEAESLIEQAILHNQLWENPNHCAYAWMVKARFSIQKRNFQDAASELEQSDFWVQKGSVVPNLIALIDSTRVQLFIHSGALEEAKAWLKNHAFITLPENAIINEVDEILRLAASRVFLAINEPLTAASFLKPIEQTARAGNRITTLIETLILQACIPSNPVAAMKSVKEALTLGIARGYHQVFLDDGEKLMPLLANCMELLGVSDLIATLRTEEPAPSQDGLLTARELEILRWMAAGLSNPEIGQQLYISVGTVKAHSTAIYRKLNVANRAEAIAFAKDQDYL